MAATAASTSASSKSGPALIQSKFNTVYRHSVLDILTHYAEIPTDPNPDNNPLASRDPHESLANDPSVTQTLSSKKEEATRITNVKIKSIDFDQVTISFKHPMVQMEMLRPIAFDEKCNSWEEVEQKMIEMSKIAAKSRKLSHIRVSGIRYPTSFFNVLLLFLVLLLPFGYRYPELLYDNFFAKYLPLMMHCKAYHNRIFFTTLLLHLGEVYFFIVPRLQKYRVPLDYAIEWIFLGLLDGYSSVRRFDSYLECITPDDTYYDFTETDYFL